jgi:hypothetical protein
MSVRVSTQSWEPFRRTSLSDQPDDKDCKVGSEKVLVEAYWPYDREELGGETASRSALGQGSQSKIEHILDSLM